MAVPFDAVASFIAPIAVEKWPDATLPFPREMDWLPDATVPNPMAKAAPPEAFVLAPAAKLNRPMLSLSQLAFSINPTRKAALEGYHIMRRPGPLAGGSP